MEFPKCPQQGSNCKREGSRRVHGETLGHYSQTVERGGFHRLPRLDRRRCFKFFFQNHAYHTSMEPSPNVEHESNNHLA